MSLRVLCFALLWLPVLAHAGPTPAPAPAADAGDATEADEPDDGPIAVPDARALLKDDDDDDFQIDLGPAPAPAPAPATPALDLDPGTALPLSGVRAPVIVATTADAVVVEQPVYVAHTRTDTEAGFLLVTTFSVGDEKVAEVRQVIESDGLAPTTPTWAFPKAMVPAATPTGTVKVQVATAALDGTEATVAFTKTVSWHLAE